MIPTETKSRPKLLTWLCLGSAIFGTFWIIMLVTLIILSLKGQLPSGLFPGLAIGYLQAGYLFMCALILLALLGLAGVFMMWQQKKAGFYLYTTVKTMIYFLPVLIIGNNHLTYPGLILTSITIIMYGTIFTATAKQKE